MVHIHIIIMHLHMDIPLLCNASQARRRIEEEEEEHCVPNSLLFCNKIWRPEATYRRTVELKLKLNHKQLAASLSCKLEVKRIAASRASVCPCPVSGHQLRLSDLPVSLPPCQSVVSEAPSGVGSDDDDRHATLLSIACIPHSRLRPRLYWS